jgi:RNA-directed DNA polymerase
VVNGPEDPPPEPGLDAVDWDWVDWSGCEREVRRLRQRIFKATQEGDWPRVRSLQKLMLRSRSNTLLSVRQVTQRNAGRKTAGIDGEVALTWPRCSIESIMLIYSPRSGRSRPGR